MFFLIYAFTSIGIGAYFRAFKKNYVKIKHKYLYWFFQLILISCAAHIFAYAFYLEQANIINALKVVLIYGVFLIVLCYIVAFISAGLLISRRKI